MKLKQLEFNDIYELADIVKDLDFELTDDEIKQFEGDTTKAGIRMYKKALGNLKKTKPALNKFLGHMFGMSGEEFGKLGLRDLGDALKQLNDLKNSEEVKLFFELVGQLTQSK